MVGWPSGRNPGFLRRSPALPDSRPSAEKSRGLMPHTQWIPFHREPGAQTQNSDPLKVLVEEPERVTKLLVRWRIIRSVRLRAQDRATTNVGPYPGNCQPCFSSRDLKGQARLKGTLRLHSRKDTVRAGSARRVKT